MNVLILGAGGFIGTNLVKRLAEIEIVKNIKLVDFDSRYFETIKQLNLENVKYVSMTFDQIICHFDDLCKNQNLVFHLISTTIPSTTNQHISEEINNNTIFTTKLCESLAKNSVQKLIYISSGGTVYGDKGDCALDENTNLDPINAYGLQKLISEEVISLYNHLYRFDYNIVRLSNPYGPYQRPNGKLGALTTFTYKAMNNETIHVYGDGSVVRDYIYIEDVITAIMNISFNNTKYHVYNIGSGVGVSLNKLIKIIEKSINKNVSISYEHERDVDLPINYLNVNRYESEFGKCSVTNIDKGVELTKNFLNNFYNVTTEEVK